VAEAQGKSKVQSKLANEEDTRDLIPGLAEAWGHDVAVVRLPIVIDEGILQPSQQPHFNMHTGLNQTCLNARRAHDGAMCLQKHINKVILTISTFAGAWHTLTLST
jgi:hypothetical protein